MSNDIVKRKYLKLSKKQLFVVVLVLLVTILLVECMFRYIRLSTMKDAQSMYRSAGYTGGLVFSFADLLFDEDGNTPASVERLIKPNSIENGTHEQLSLIPSTVPGPSRYGHFLTNRDGWFWWFDKDGKILQENNFKLNNLGLISIRNFSKERIYPSFRIIVIGDELTAATTANKSWPDHLQEVLNRSSELSTLGPIEVINFGWPDAGFNTFRSVWFDKAAAMKPDLVIVNIAEHLFDRMPNPEARLPSGPKYKTFWEPFTADNGLRAWLIINCYGEGRRLRDPDCNTGRPFGLWLPKKLAQDKAALAQVQDQIVYDYIGRLVWFDFRLTFAQALVGKLKDPLDIRTFKGNETNSIIQPLTPEKKLEYAENNLKAIKDNFPRTMIIINRNFTELAPIPTSLILSTQLQKANPELGIIDMIDYLPYKQENIATWYQVGIAQEKWSDKGHEINAKAVAHAVIENIRDRKK